MAVSIRNAVGITAGDPVVSVGLHRLIITDGTMRAMGASTPGQLQPALQAFGQITVREISDTTVETLLGARHGPESPVPKIDPTVPEIGADFDWHLRECGFPAAWAQLNAADFRDINWTDVLVGQVDTGFCEHPALGFAAGQSTTVDTARDENFFRGDFSLPGFSEDDAHDPLLGAAFQGHGTRTGSVLAGCFVRESLNGAVNGYFGAAPKVPYVPVRIADSVLISGQQVELANAINYLVSIGCGVITLSMGFPLVPLLPGQGVLLEVRNAINGAYEAGVIFVCASGNVVPNVVAPAALRRTIAIGGSTKSLEPWTGGSCGVEVDISAPAWPIYRATMDRKGRPTFGFGDGTSFATALTAGAAALWLAKHRAVLLPTYPQPWQRVAAFKALLRNTANPPPGWDTTNFGTGILNADALLAAPLPAAASLQREQRA